MKKVDLITAEKHIRELDLSFVTDEDVSKIDSVVKRNFRNIVLSSDNPSFNTACALKYALGEKPVFSKVIYAHFDREEFLYTDNMKQHSIDCLLKACLCRPFVVSDFENENCAAENYLLRFENESDENTLVIVDGYDIPAPSPYMRHLFSLGCCVLVLTKNTPNTLYADSVHVSFDVERPVVCFDDLGDEPKELLMTLCAIFEHLDTSIPIVSSKSGVFDKSSVRFYLGRLSEHLELLEQKGFLEILPSGRIYIERFIRKAVIEKLSPSAENCKTFISFVSRILNYSLLQNAKDVSALIRTASGNYDTFSSSLEFICAYTYFAHSDKHCAIRLYNALFTHILKNCAMNENSFYMGNLLLKNAAYYIYFISENSSCDSDMLKMYEQMQDDKEMPCEVYTQNIKLRLDIIRLCVSVIRNITVDMYKFYNPVFEMLLSTMSEIFEFVKEGSFENKIKMYLLDDVLRLCYENFALFCVVDNYGVYNARRDSFDKRRILYFCEPETDKTYGDGIVFGESIVTLKLYSMYAQYLDAWIYLEDNTKIKHRNELLAALHERKLNERKILLYLINIHFSRIVKGYERCVDIYVPERKVKNIFEYEADKGLEKRLEDNKRFIKRGFDAGTKKGAEEYSDKVINEILHGKNPLAVATTVLSAGYPLSDESYVLLKKKGLADALCKSDSISNLSLQILLEFLVSSYPSIHAEGQKMLYEHLITLLSEKVTCTEAFLERMYRLVSKMYVTVFRLTLEEKKKIVTCGFCDETYEKYCCNKKIRYKYCDDYIAKILYVRSHGRSVKINNALLQKALMIHGLENGDCDVSCLVSYLLK